MTNSRTHTTSTRLFSEIYDSVKQRELVNQSTWKTDYIARIRLDLLLSNNLILTDTQLLDGAFYTKLDPSELEQHIPLDRLEIRARDADLSNALLGFVYKPNADKLRGFTFSAINDAEIREKARRHLAQLSSSKIRKDWREIPRLLRHAGVDEATTDLLEERWAHWIEASTSGKIRVIKWEGKFDLDNAFQPKYANALSKLSTEHARITATRAWGHRHNRSYVDPLLNEALSEAEGEESKAEIKWILSWFHQAYNRTLKNQHKCDSFDYADVFGAKAIEPNKKSFDKIVEQQEDLPKDVSVYLSNDFIKKVGAIPLDKYRGYAQSSDLVRWWNYGDIESLKMGIEPFVNDVTKETNIQPVGVASWVLPVLKQLVRLSETDTARWMGRGGGGVIGYLVGGSEGALFGAGLGTVLGEATHIAGKNVAPKTVPRFSPSGKITRHIVEHARSRVKEP